MLINIVVMDETYSSRWKKLRFECMGYYKKFGKQNCGWYIQEENGKLVMPTKKHDNTSSDDVKLGSLFSEDASSCSAASLAHLHVCEWILVCNVREKIDDDDDKWDDEKWRGGWGFL